MNDSNSQTVLDLVFLLMLHPRIVILANQRALSNPYFGPAIRYTDFIYASEGLDSLVDLVKTRMNEGYSVIIFPEGTRSTDSKIKRFHKGAFYIAEKLNIEITPIILHGAGDLLNKNSAFALWPMPVIRICSSHIRQWQALLVMLQGKRLKVTF